jgi:hypothetical protein
LIEWSYDNPDSAGEVFHHISAVAMILELNLQSYNAAKLEHESQVGEQVQSQTPQFPPPPPYISQQSIIQLQQFSQPNGNQINLNVNRLAMIGNAIGNIRLDGVEQDIRLHNARLEIIKDRADTPHPDFVAGILNINDKNQTLWTVKNWADRKPVKIVNRNIEAQGAKDLQVQMINMSKQIKILKKDLKLIQESEANPSSLEVNAQILELETEIESKEKIRKNNLDLWKEIT